MLGPWIEMAKKFAGNNTDCATDVGPGYPTITDCTKFYEWNARVQLTTWNPTPKGSGSIPGGPIDYASKHWSGLIADYYGARVTLVKNHALQMVAQGKPHNNGNNQLLADHAYNWTTATNPYPTQPTQDFVKVSVAMHAKYASFFAVC
jgi:hypothetical protein